MRNEINKKLLDPQVRDAIMIVDFTTSRKCKDHELSRVKDESTGDFLPMKISFWSRPLGNKCAYALYKTCRIVYVGWYFYFTPFCTIVLSFLLPILADYINFTGNTDTGSRGSSSNLLPPVFN